MGNAAEVFDRAAVWNAELILSGHEHHPAITLPSRCTQLDKEVSDPLPAVGAGSFSVIDEELGPIKHNHYHIIHRRKEKVVIISRCLDQDGDRFEEHARWRIPIARSGS